MILINKEQVRPELLAGKLGVKIPLDKIKKKPLYEINPALIFKDYYNGPGATKTRQAMEFPTYFRAKLSNGENVEIRYCTSRTPDRKTHGQTEIYTPLAVEFEGKAEFIADDEDKALYFWLHFFNKTSPFRKSGTHFEYELVDDDAKANEIIESLTLRSKATSHASSLSGDEMIIIAKGMKIAGASAMEPMMIKAQLMQYASDKPGEYLTKAESTVNHIHGLVYDSIDKGIFILDTIYNTKRWKWAMGAKIGEVIVEISANIPDEREALINHVSLNIQEFLPVLINTSKTINAKSNLEKAVENVNVLDMLKPDNIKDEFEEYGYTEPAAPEVAFTPVDLQNDLPTSFKEAMEYLGQKIGKKTPALASVLFNGIKDGSTTAENIDEVLEDLRTR